MILELGSTAIVHELGEGAVTVSNAMLAACSPREYSSTVKPESEAELTAKVRTDPAIRAETFAPTPGAVPVSTWNSPVSETVAWKLAPGHADRSSARSANASRRLQVAAASPDRMPCTRSTHSSRSEAEIRGSGSERQVSELWAADAEVGGLTSEAV